MNTGGEWENVVKAKMLEDNEGNTRVKKDMI